LDIILKSSQQREFSLVVKDGHNGACLHPKRNFIIGVVLVDLVGVLGLEFLS